MTIAPGGQIGPYTVNRELGRGGMGVVYLGRDTRLDRNVAIKALPEALAQDPDRMARFEREARTLASLNHPNIAGIHGVEEHDGARYLVLEYVEGETLAELLHRGPLPVADAIEIAVQIAAGVEAAHEAGVIHRDLKPGNIIVTPEGQAKVLDFGLARTEETSLSSGGMSESPTLTSPAIQHSPTMPGVILGTAAYMSPEQARGRKIDKRTDIWSFGVVLYEMLTGASPFRGDTVSDSIGAVLHKNIEFETLPSTTPSVVRHVLERCLQRDRNVRYRDIGDVRLELTLSSSASRSVTPPATRPTNRAIGFLAVLGWLLALGAAAWALVASPNRPGSSTRPVALSMTAPPGSIWETGANVGWAIIAPDGNSVVARARSENESGLWVRTLSDPRGRYITGTANAYYPFWSPDSRRLAFFAEGWLQVVELDGGLPERIAPVDAGRGGSWSETGGIVFSPVGGGPIHTVDPSGGESRAVTALDVEAGENAHYWPQWLPDGERFLYMIRTRSQNDQGVYLGRVTDGIDTERRRIVAAASSAWFVPEHEGEPAMLLWVHDETLLARRFDWRTGELAGPTARIAQNVRVLPPHLASMISASENGVIVYASTRFGEERLVWHERDGGASRSFGQLRGAFAHLALSPDGEQVATTRIDRGQANIWVYDIATETSRQVTNLAGYSEAALWSPDSRQLLFRYDSSRSALLISADGSGSARPVFEPPVEPAQDIAAWMPGDWLVYFRDRRPGVASGRLMTARLDAIEATERELWDVSDTRVHGARFSRNGRFFAFYNVVRGSSRLIVQSVELGPDGPRLRNDQLIVPIADPMMGVFAHDETKLFVVAENGSVFAIDIERTEEAGLRLGRPERLDVQITAATGQFFLADPSGDRFLVVTDPHAANQTFEVLTDWRAAIDEE